MNMNEKESLPLPNAAGSTPVCIPRGAPNEFGRAGPNESILILFGGNIINIDQGLVCFPNFCARQHLSPEPTCIGSGRNEAPNRSQGPSFSRFDTLGPTRRSLRARLDLRSVLRLGHLFVLCPNGPRGAGVMVGGGWWVA